MSAVPEWTPDGPKLIYVAMADHLAARIEAGEFLAGRRLPPVRELTDEYGVSVPTAQRAVDLLRERGLAVTIRGKGTYVTEAEATPDQG